MYKVEIDLKKIQVNYVLFFAFFFLYFILGLAITFQNSSIVNQYDIIFGADCPRVYADFIYIAADHYRTKVHPLQLIEIQPIIKLLYSFICSQKAAVLVLNSIVVSSMVILIKSICQRITQKHILSLLMALLFGFSFNSFLYVSIPETYIFGALFNLLLLHYLIILYDHKEPISFYNVIVIVLLTLFSFGIIMVNIIPSLIMITYFMFLFNKNKQVNLKQFFKNFFLLFIILFVVLSLFQKLAYPSSRLFFKGVEGDLRYVTMSTDSNVKLPYLMKGITESFYSLENVKIENKDRPNGMLKIKEKQNPWRYLFVSLLLISAFVTYILNFKKQKNVFIFPIASILAINFIELYFYGTLEPFLYSFNHFPYFVILLALLFSSAKEIFIKIVFGLFILLQIFFNFPAINAVINFASFGELKHCSILIWALYSLLVTVIFICLFFLYEKFSKNNIFKYSVQDRYKISLIIYCVFIIMSLIMTAVFHGKV